MPTRLPIARNVLDVIAIVFLVCGAAFWLVAFWQLFEPPALLSLLSIQVLVLALAFALAAPLLLSMLVPTTPAGQLLQKTKWATIGFYVIVGAGLFLVYQAEQLIELWLYAQPGVYDAGLERRLAFVLVIAFIIVPALSWVQLTPERWAAQVEQAHQVKKLEMQQRGELAIIKASLIRAERLALKGWANLLPLEREEIMGTIKGLLQGTSDAQRSIVRTLQLGADLEREIMKDDEIAQQLDYVTENLDVLPDISITTAAQSIEQSQREPLITPPPEGYDAFGIPLTDGGKDGGEAIPAAPRSAPQRYAVELRSAGMHFKAQPFTLAALASVLDMKERTARDRLNAWLTDGLARPSDTRGHFYLTEGG